MDDNSNSAPRPGPNQPDKWGPSASPSIPTPAQESAFGELQSSQLILTPVPHIDSQSYVSQNQNSYKKRPSKLLIGIFIGIGILFICGIIILISYSSSHSDNNVAMSAIKSLLDEDDFDYSVVTDITIDEVLYSIREDSYISSDDVVYSRINGITNLVAKTMSEQAEKQNLSLPDNFEFIAENTASSVQGKWWKMSSPKTNKSLTSVFINIPQLSIFGINFSSMNKTTRQSILSVYEKYPYVIIEKSSGSNAFGITNDAYSITIDKEKYTAFKNEIGIAASDDVFPEEMLAIIKTPFSGGSTLTRLFYKIAGSDYQAEVFINFEDIASSVPEDAKDISKMQVNYDLSTSIFKYDNKDNTENLDFNFDFTDFDTDNNAGSSSIFN